MVYMRVSRSGGQQKPQVKGVMGMPLGQRHIHQGKRPSLLLLLCLWVTRKEEQQQRLCEKRMELWKKRREKSVSTTTTLSHAETYFFLNCMAFKIKNKNEPRRLFSYMLFSFSGRRRRDENAEEEEEEEEERGLPLIIHQEKSRKRSPVSLKVHAIRRWSISSHCQVKKKKKKKKPVVPRALKMANSLPIFFFYRTDSRGSRSSCSDWHTAAVVAAHCATSERKTLYTAGRLLCHFTMKKEEGRDDSFLFFFLDIFIITALLLLLFARSLLYSPDPLLSPSIIHRVSQQPAPRV